MAEVLLSCQKCGAQYPKRSGRGNQRRYCDPCRPEMMRGWRGPDGKWVQPIRVYGSPFRCIDCRGMFKAEGAGQKRCRGCRNGHSVRVTREYKRRTGYKRPDAKVRVGDVFACQNCSADVIRETGIQKLCRACQNDYRRIQYQRPDFKLKHNLNVQVRKALRGHQPKGWCNRFAFTVDELKTHLERQFLRGMSWQNYGYGLGKWHIDHIRPVASFDLGSDPDQAVRECWGLANLRPLWGVDNQKKSDRRLLLI